MIAPKWLRGKAGATGASGPQGLQGVVRFGVVSLAPFDDFVNIYL